MAKLLVQYPSGPQSEFVMGARPVVMVGRELDNTLVLKDPHVSRKHFYIRNDSGSFTLVNLSHTHGTIVNGQRTERCDLRHKDIIEAGGAKMTFILDETDAQTAQIPRQDGPAPLADDPIRKDGPRGKVVFEPEGDETGAPNLLATSDPGKSQMLKDIESAMGADLSRRFHLLQDIGREMVAQLNLDTLLEFLLDKIFEILPADNGLILLIDRETSSLAPMAVRTRKGKARPEKLRVSQTLLKHCFQKRVGVLSADALSDERFSGQQSIMALGIHSVMCAPLIFQDEILGVIQVDTQTAKNTFSREDLDLLTMMANQAALSVRNSRLHDKIVQEETRRANYERYFSPQIASKIAANEIQLDSGGRSIEATILFADIRNFTTISERTEPGELVRFLNRYFTITADLVFEFNGTLDKFIGDALVAVFGSPIAHPDDAINAARCAARIIERVRQTSFEVGEVAVGIGLHYGTVVHGNIGSEKVMQYTCIGDTVNTASRLSSIAAPNQIILSPAMQNNLAGRIETRPLGAVELKGKSEPMETFELTRCL